MALPNKRLERTRRERASLLSCVGKPLKRKVGWLSYQCSKQLNRTFIEYLRGASHTAQEGEVLNTQSSTMLMK
jgi:hypothetical protein